jgi:hypothetical protein
MGWGNWGAWLGSRSGQRQCPSGVAEMRRASPPFTETILKCGKHDGPALRKAQTDCPTRRGAFPSRAGQPISKAELGSVLVPVGRFGCEPDFPLCLFEQIFCLCGVAAHVPLVGLLRGGDAVIGLVDQVLRRPEVGMPGPLRNQHAARKTCYTENGAQNEFASYHRENLRSHNSRQPCASGNKKIAEQSRRLWREAGPAGTESVLTTPVRAGSIGNPRRKTRPWRRGRCR